MFGRAGLPSDLVDTVLDALRAHARVAVHFHPDRLFRDDRTVAEGLRDVGAYRNQYDTGISGGSLTAFPGGERHRWEEDLFGGAYSEDALSARPKYGALQLLRHPDGPAPRFGSAYLLLSAEATERSTFTFQGSQESTALRQSGPLDVMEPVLAALLRTAEGGGEVLGRQCSGVADLVGHLLQDLPRLFSNPPRGKLGRALDSFVEAQVHGPVHLAEDVERLVADPVYLDTKTGNVLREVAREYGVALSWHPGYTLPVRNVPKRFRGYATGPLARRIAGDGSIDAAKIGAAANSYRLEPELWRELGSQSEARTHFRRMWHVLVQKALPLNAQGRVRS